MTKQIDTTLRAQIKQLPILDTVTNSNSTYHIVGRYSCDVCGKDGAICIRERGRDLYSRCGCGVDARPSLVVQRHKLNMCLVAHKTQNQVAPVAVALPAVPTPHPQQKQQPKNLLEYLLNFQIIPL